ncbi:hypothetical protein [Prochlorococcus marinus]|uniref:hypothetical protein n=1 Tax=Prochlorococcus marinus TaxID=1219 RepID=UPI001ADC7B68|nr:hypothetical protein [Prochlorococcus marinus]MBO8219549.1 hypothetical protein [Prochlorococcus marinus CUG1416]MBW3051920.1 hypothetical protein [Prochlorococcus marinus str. MU1416]
MRFKDSLFHIPEKSEPKPLILTRPIFLGLNTTSIPFILWIFLRITKVLTFKQNLKNIFSSGHGAVYNSLVRGSLSRLDFNNWGKITGRKKVVVISSRLAALQMHFHKKNGFIERLYAGPNIEFIFFRKNFPYLSGILVPSKESSSIIRSANYENFKKTLIWPSGVDPKYWENRKTNKKKSEILIYYKNQKGPIPSKDIIKLKLSSFNLNINFIDYGSYTIEEYKKALEKSKFMIFLSRDETQGLAFFEAWSMNVFTYVWEYKVKTNEGLDYEGCVCPYINKSVGKYVNNFDCLIRSIKNKDYSSKDISPRNWILKNGTDKISVSKLIKLISC